MRAKKLCEKKESYACCHANTNFNESLSWTLKKLGRPLLNNMSSICFIKDFTPWQLKSIYCICNISEYSSYKDIYNTLKDLDAIWSNQRELVKMMKVSTIAEHVLNTDMPYRRNAVH